MPDWIDVPDQVLEHLRSISSRLPETTEKQTFTGKCWQVRKNTFVDVRAAVVERAPVCWLTFRLVGPELDAVLASGHPFRPTDYGADMVVMIVEETTDWSEAAELITESYRLAAPKKLIARLGESHA